MDTFNEALATTSRKCVAGEGIMMPNLWQASQSFLFHYFVFALEKFPRNLHCKNAKFSVFLPLKEHLVASLSETCALTSGTNVTEKKYYHSELIRNT